MSQKPKHHYVPIFYLKQWAGSDGRLCVYSRPYKKVVPHRRHPDETGYERGLNTLSSFPPQLAEILEQKLFGRTDDNAARALHLLLDGNIDGLGDDLRSAWVRFIISLARRNPEAIRRLYRKLGDIFEQHIVPTIPVTSDAALRQQFIERHLAMHLQELLNSTFIGNRMINMLWSVVRFDRLTYPLLTSDRPFVMTNGIAWSDSHIAIPISPNRCFVATASVVEQNRLRTIDPEWWVLQNNDRMGRQARQFVYGADDTQLRFVANRFGKKEISYPGEED